MRKVKKRLTEQYWKIWRGSLRPGIIDTRIMEIQTKEGQTVIPWSGFDDCSISMTERLAIARAIVRDHNGELNRLANMAGFFN